MAHQELPSLPLPPTLEALQSWLIAEVARTVGVGAATIDPGAAFTRYNLASRQTTELIAKLGQSIGQTLSPTLAWAYPTITALARHLSGAKEESAITADHSTPRVTHAEPIAIIGMACRFPQAASPQAFWQLLCNAQDAVIPTPIARWDVGELFDAELTAAGKMTTRWGGFLEDVAQFDPQFFGISPREAVSIDPQQRLMLELSWEALEDAGVPAQALRGSATAVYFGAMWSDYAQVPGNERATITPYTATGQDLSIIPARVSYALGLQGPSVAINTACSSSLVAVHLACQSLQSGQSELALCGGVNLLLAPESSVAMSKFGAMSPDGRCKAFDARANGYVRGEGAGVIVLKPLSRALADGDPIYCTILGSAVNNDGFSNGLTAPNPKAQEAVLRAAYRDAAVAPAQVQYVEAHGTGTMLGDPIEARALGQVLGAERAAARPLRLGSVKTNLGHLEAAAGIAGLIKTALAIKHRTLPPTLHFQQPNPDIPFAELRLQVQQKLEPWPEETGPLLAGVSSFGFGGTNCHVVLAGAETSGCYLVPLQAASAADLQQTARALGTRAAAPLRPPLAELCAATVDNLVPGDVRLAFTVRSYTDLDAQLQTFLSSDSPVAPARDAERPKLVFMFGGLGSQWRGMGRDLLRDEPVFRQVIERCDQAMAPYVDYSLLQLLTTDDPRLENESAVAQPAVFAIELALAALWRHYGIEPAAVVGQSMGEVAAAYVAGALSLEDAARIMCRRSQIVGRVRGRGGMAVVDLDLAASTQALRGYADRLSVGVSSSPHSTVISGDSAALGSLVKELEGQGVFCRRLNVDYASHSPHMDELLPELKELLQEVKPRAATIPFYSTVTGTLLPGEQLDADYWVRNLREPVLFAGTTQLLLQEGYNIFLDVNPHPLLIHPVEQSLRFVDRAALVLPSMRRVEAGREVLFGSLGALYGRGFPVNWEHVYPRRAAKPSASAAAEPQLLTLSARSPEALQELAHATATWINDRPELRVTDLCYTANVRRSHHGQRLAVVGRTKEELTEGLVNWLRENQDAPPPPLGSVARPRVVFVFPGQGSQWLGMGRSLFAREPQFRATIEACEQALLPWVDFSLTAELHAAADTSRLGELAVVQPVLWAFQVALAALWEQWGVRPDAVLGHSLGEVAAACVAGALSLQDAAQVIAQRSQLVGQHASGKGGMALVELPLAAAEQLIAGRQALLAVGVNNGPRSSVISGDPVALEQVLTELRQREIFCRRINVDYASHSPQMEPLLPLLRESLAAVTPRAATTPFFSTVTADWQAGEGLDAAYWADNLRRPVRFGSSVHALRESGHALFIEISPHPVLLPSITDNLETLGGTVVASLRREEDETLNLLRALATIYCCGVSPNFEKLYAGDTAAEHKVVPLPLYPWQRQRYWPVAPATASTARGEGRISTAAWGDAQRRSRHPLLGNRFTSPAYPGTHIWEGAVDLTALPYLHDHQVKKLIVLPATAYLELALSAAGELYGDGLHNLEAVSFDAALLLSPEALRTVQVVVTETAEQISFQIFSRAVDDAEADTASAASWTSHASGKIARRDSAHGSQSEMKAEPPTAIEQRLGNASAGAAFYAELADWGLWYGPSFCGVTQLCTAADEAVSRVKLPSAAQGAGASYTLHPAWLDAGMHALLSPLLRRGQPGPYVPVHLQALRILKAPDLGAVTFSHARLQSSGPEETPGFYQGDVQLFNEAGDLLVELRGLRLQQLTRALAPSQPTAGIDDGLFLKQWQPAPQQSVAPRPRGRWLLLPDQRGLAAELRAQLQARGELVVWAEDMEQSSDAALDALLQSATSEDVPLSGVVLLTSLDQQIDPAAPSQASLDQALETGLLRALRVVQALARTTWRDPPRLWLCTRGVHGASLDPNAGTGQTLEPWQAPLWGFGQTVLYEHPELHCTCVDLGSQALTTAAAELSAELLASGTEKQIALGPQGRHVARLVRSTLPPAATTPISADGTYLITGGLGALGLAVAQWLVEQGARALVLIGRHGVTADAQSSVIAKFQECGARVHVHAVDVADRAALAELLSTISQQLPPLRGVLHAAGVLDDGLLTQQSRERFLRVLAPKVYGAWNLHVLTAALPLDFFVLYSSVTSLLGSPGQSGYAAANAFLDSLAHLRKARGLPALSINWGPFADVGLAAQDERRGARLAQRGLGSVEVARAHAVLGQLLGSAVTQLAVAPLDLRQWTEFYPVVAALPLLSALPQSRGPGTAGRKVADLRRTLTSAAPAERTRLVEQLVQEQSSQVLHIELSRMHRETNLINLGLDSLTGLELRNRLERALRTRLPSTLLWTYPRIDALAGHLLTLVYPPHPTAENTRVLPTAEVAPDLDSSAVAIVGLGCRFPGAASSPEAFWELLKSGSDAIREVAPERWPLGATSASLRGARWAGLLDGDVGGFDAAFFAIAPREACSLDPQQRLLLEVSFEALEHAGIAPARLAGSNTGVFVGIMNLDYQDQVKARPLAQLDAYSTTGNLHSTAAGRLSYVLDLHGPCMAIDTACSSSLVAVHLACQSLRRGESAVALAGGVNLLLSAINMQMIAQTQALAPDGRCKAFDARADGFVRGEGCGVVVLKRYQDARRDGDRIWALIPGSAVNQDGHSTGLTAPNVLSQQALLRAALDAARLVPADVDYIEAHGTGTSLGDPIELEALTAVLGQPRPAALARTSCAVGSVKTNLGHLESAAGVAGLIKVVLALQHELIPRHLHFQTLNPRIQLAGTCLVIPTVELEWKRGRRPRRAGVSSFGISGTNAHVLVQEAPLPDLAVSADAAARETSTYVLPLSAKSRPALQQLAQTFQDALLAETGPLVGVTLADICYTASVRRSHHSERMVVMGATRQELVQALSAARKEENFVSSAESAGGVMATLAARYRNGESVDWQQVYPGVRSPVPLPRYPWQREHYWLDEAPVGAPAAALLHHPTGHPLLGGRREVAADPRLRVWESSLRTAELPYLEDHRVGSLVVLPAAGYIEMILAAARELDLPGPYSIEELKFAQLLVLTESEATRVQLVLRTEQTGKSSRAAFEIFSRPVQTDSTPADDLTWTRHAQGVLCAGNAGTQLRPVAPLPARPTADPEALANHSQHILSRQQHYERMAAVGIPYGPRFQAVVDVLVGSTDAVARIRLPEGLTLAPYVLHPVLLDACFQGFAALAVKSGDRRRGVAGLLPMGIGELRLVALPSPGATELTCHVTACLPQPGRPGEPERVHADLRIYEGADRLILEVVGLALQRIELDQANRPLDPASDWYYDLIWQPSPASAAGSAPDSQVAARTARTWIIFADRGGVGSALRERLVAQGDACIVVRQGAQYRRTAECEYEEVPVDQAGYSTLLRDGAAALAAAGGGQKNIDAIVHLWSLDLGQLEPAEGVALATACAQSCGSILTLVQAVAQAGYRDAPRLFLVTGGAQAVAGAGAGALAQAPIWGFGRTLAHEHPELLCTLIDLDPEGYGAVSDRAAVQLDALLLELRAAGEEDQVAFRFAGGSSVLLDRYVARLVRAGLPATEPSLPLAPAGSRPFGLEIDRPGVLTKLQLRARAPRALAAGEVELRVAAAGLNFLDVLLALGAMTEESAGGALGNPPLGRECVGRVVAVGPGVSAVAVGDRVLALALRCLGTQAIVDQRLVLPAPPELSDAAAATIPLAFLTAYYSLHHVARLKRGERVLIHAATGGVGLAAVQVARWLGAEIFATAGSEEKRHYLRTLGVPHVLGSRDLDFVKEIRQRTEAQGVDVVLNSLSGEFIPASLDLLRDYGRFIEIGKRDAAADLRIGLRPFLRKLSFTLVDLRGQLIDRPEEVRSVFAEVLAHFAAGTFTALPHRVFPIAEAADAFAYMARAEHLGKVVLAVDADESACCIAAAPRELLAGVPVLPDRTYLITGGLGGIGLRLAQWFVEQGARHLVLLGRREPSAAAQDSLAALRAAGAQVKVAQVDVSVRAQLAALLTELGKSAVTPPIAGVVHAAGLLDDSTVGRMTLAQIERVMAPKILGAWNLHELLCEQPLDLFVLCSSCAALLGSPGQANYTAANAFLDALAHHRRTLALPALSINWGAWTEVGLAAQDHNRGERLASRGLEGLSPDEGATAFAELLDQGATARAAMRLYPRQWQEFHLAAARSRLLSELTATPLSSAQRASGTFIAQLNAVPAAEQRAALAEHLRQQAARVLRCDPARLTAATPLQQGGLDSLMAMELRNRLEMSLGLPLSVTLIWRHPTVAALADHFGTALKLPPAALPIPILAAVPEPSELPAAAAAASGADKIANVLRQLKKMRTTP